MVGAIHFLAIAGSLMAAIGVSIRAERASPSMGRVLIVIALVSTVGFLATGFLVHLCDRGQPELQLAIALICLALPLLTVKHPTRAAISAALCATPMLAVCVHYRSVVHQVDWTGTPVSRIALLGQIREEAVARLRTLGARDSTPCPPGWLDDVRFLPPDDGLYSPPVDCSEATALWHTPLTRLWRRRERYRSLWYPGGPLLDAAERIEWREDPRR